MVKLTLNFNSSDSVGLGDHDHQHSVSPTISLMSNSPPVGGGVGHTDTYLRPNRSSTGSMSSRGEIVFCLNILFRLPVLS